MFVGYNVSLTNADLDKYYSIGKNLNDTQKEELKTSLSDFLKDGIIDGTKLESVWFPNIKADVFISYSHNDEKMACSFAGFLNEVFGLNIFVDSNIWGSTDELLKEIDKEYAKGDKPNTFIYEKRNFTTSHVHMILANAIMKVMDNAECIFLLNTNESIPKINDLRHEDYTHSPWLYTEIMLTKFLRKRELVEYRDKPILEGFEKSANEKLKIQYKVSLDNLISIDWDNINSWAQTYRTKDYLELMNHNVYSFALDYLYKATIDDVYKKDNTGFGL